MSPGPVGPAVDWNDRLAAARPEGFAELFHEAITDDFGAVARLRRMLETASEWCRAHGARSSACELDALADRLTDIGEELLLVGEDAGRELRSRTHRLAAATRVSPTVSVRGPSAVQQSEAPAHFPPPTARSLPRSR
ncbi:hypothetical protein AB5J72_38515 [Streptomyces sp. CG1]|uniref:hypothetical protein n=1 Tax=Streptomyces sp. CG1 TaxID=1287523 RepID=UPI0034E21B59